MGGAVGHKGFGLALMIDVLAGALSEAGCVRPGVPTIRDGMLVIAIDIARFTPLAVFRERVRRANRPHQKLAAGAALYRDIGAGRSRTSSARCSVARRRSRAGRNVERTSPRGARVERAAARNAFGTTSRVNEPVERPIATGAADRTPRVTHRWSERQVAQSVSVEARRDAVAAGLLGGQQRLVGLVDQTYRTDGGRRPRGDAEAAGDTQPLAGGTHWRGGQLDAQPLSQRHGLVLGSNSGTRMQNSSPP